MTDHFSDQTPWERGKARRAEKRADKETRKFARARQTVLDSRAAQAEQGARDTQPDLPRKRPPVITNQNAAPKRNWPVAIVGFILLLLLFVSFGGPALVSSLADDRAKAAIENANKQTQENADKAAQDIKAAKEAADAKVKDAEKKAEEASALAKQRADELEKLRNSQKPGDGATAQPGTTPGDAVTAEQMTAAINQLKAGGLDPKDGTFTINWAKNDALQAGAMEFCKPSAHTASALVDRLKTCPLALSTFMDGAGVTEAQALDTNALVAWQSNKKLHYAKGMSFDNNGNVQWGNDFVDPEGAVLWINTHATKPFFLRDRCLNGTRPPVVTTQQPTFTPIGQPAPPITTIVHNPPKEVPPPVKYCKPGIPVGDKRCEEIKYCKPGIPVGDKRCEEIKYCKPGIPVGDKRCEEIKYCKPGIPVGDKRCEEIKYCKPGIPVGDVRCDAKDPSKSHPTPGDHDPAKGDTPKTPPPVALPNPIDPKTPETAPAPPVVTAPNADPIPNPAPVPAPEVTAPTPAQPGQVFTDPDSVVTVAAPAPAVAQPVAVAKPAPVAAQAPAAAPVTKTAAPAPAVQPATQVASAPTQAAPVTAVAATVAPSTTG